MRFSEEDASNSTNDISESLLSDHGHPEIPVPEPDPPQTATTPWIALVACDGNSTHASQDVDVFTLANDRGAVGAVRIISLCERYTGCSHELASLLGMVKRLYYQ